MVSSPFIWTEMSDKGRVHLSCTGSCWSIKPLNSWPWQLKTKTKTWFGCMSQQRYGGIDSLHKLFVQFLFAVESLRGNSNLWRNEIPAAFLKWFLQMKTEAGQWQCRYTLRHIALFTTGVLHVGLGLYVTVHINQPGPLTYMHRHTHGLHTHSGFSVVGARPLICCHWP